MDSKQGREEKYHFHIHRGSNPRTLFHGGLVLYEEVDRWAWAFHQEEQRQGGRNTAEWEA